MTFEDTVKSELRPSLFPACFAGEVFDAVSYSSAIKAALNAAERIHAYDINKFNEVLTKFCIREFNDNYKSKLDQLLNELK